MIDMSFLHTDTSKDDTGEEEEVSVMDIVSAKQAASDSDSEELLNAIEESRRVATTCQICDKEMETVEALQIHLSNACLPQVENDNMILLKCRVETLYNPIDIPINAEVQRTTSGFLRRDEGEPEGGELNDLASKDVEDGAEDRIIDGEMDREVRRRIDNEE